MSDNTLNAALRRLGYGRDDMTAHGFRATASTLLNELGWTADAIERQLAHGDRNGIRSVYNYAQYLPERRLMMQAWADYLDHLRSEVSIDRDVCSPRPDPSQADGARRWLGPNRVLLRYSFSSQAKQASEAAERSAQQLIGEYAMLQASISEAACPKAP
jgi:hypothetical protein